MTSKAVAATKTSGPEHQVYERLRRLLKCCVITTQLAGQRPVEAKSCEKYMVHQAVSQHLLRMFQAAITRHLTRIKYEQY